MLNQKDTSCLGYGLTSPADWEVNKRQLKVIIIKAQKNFIKAMITSTYIIDFGREWVHVPLKTFLQIH